MGLASHWPCPPSYRKSQMRGEGPSDGGGEGHRLAQLQKGLNEALEPLQREPVRSLPPEEVKHRVHNRVSDPLPGHSRCTWKEAK